MRTGISVTLAAASLVLLGVFGLLSPPVSLAVPPAATPTMPAAYAPDIAPANFVAVVDNPFFPLQPGTTFVYRGKSEKGDEVNRVTVTTDTRLIMGVTCTVISDTVEVDGQLVELTWDWYAQDRQGNVWYFGEDTKEYEGGGVVSTAGSWEAGVDGALPGIIMQARPTAGETYRQEYYAGEAEDMARVLSLTESLTVSTGTYTGVLKTEEWTPLEPGKIEHKYFAPGVGLVKVTTPEGSDLVQLVAVQQSGGPDRDAGQTPPAQAAEDDQDAVHEQDDETGQDDQDELNEEDDQTGQDDQDAVHE